MNLRYEASGLMQGAYAYIKAHIDALNSLPPPGATWTRYDIPEDARPHLQKLVSDGAIEIVDNDGEYNRYATDPDAFQIIEKCDANRQKLLCGHSGIKNIGGGFYTCSHDHCDHRYTKDTMQILLG